MPKIGAFLKAKIALCFNIIRTCPYKKKKKTYLIANSLLIHLLFYIVCFPGRFESKFHYTQ